MQLNVAFDIDVITAAKHRALMNACLRWTMTEHKNRTIPKHFQLGANTRYQYKPITAAYSIKKKKKVHHLIPMVLKGWLLAAIRATSKVTATHTKARMYARGYFPMKDDFRDQIERVRPDEIVDMAESISKRYHILIQAENWGRKRRARRKR